MGVALLLAGLVVFLASHLFVRSRERRARVIAAIGETPYRVLFGVVSTLGVVLIAWGFARYRSDAWVDVWEPPLGMRHLTIALMLPAIVLLYASVLPGHLSRWTKYPALAAVKLWAVAHLLANGDLGSILLFGSFLAWGVIARIAAKKAGEAGAVTAPSGYINDVLVVVVGLALYFALGFFFHPYLIGVPVFKR